MGDIANEKQTVVKNIVADTGPILHLFESHALELLQRTGRIHIPEAVEFELDSLVSDWPSHRPAWIITTPLEQNRLPQADAWTRSGLLDWGEAQALALAQQIGADWFLTDDASARLVANTLGIETHGSLGVILYAAAIGQLDSAQADQYLQALADSSLWISSLVLQEARQALKQLFS